MVVNIQTLAQAIVVQLKAMWKCSLPVNWLLWYAFTVFVNALQYLSFDHIEGIASDERTLILVASGLNSLILVLGLALMDGLIEGSKRWWLKWAWGKAVGLAVAWFIADFFLFRMMSVHVATGFRLLFESGWRQLYLTIEASGVRPSQLYGFALYGFIVVAGGLALTRATWWLSRRRPITIQAGNLIIVAAGLASVLTLWELASARHNPQAKAWEEVHRIMPFSVNLLHHPRGQVLHVGQPHPARTPENIEHGQSSSINCARKQPDVLVFVLESVRGDYITRDITPNLAEFREDCLQFRDSVASANATQVSWFSLLTANQPIYFAMAQNQPQLWGSVPLRLMRDAGYQIHVAASTYLNYHDIDRVAFGPNLELASSVIDARELGGLGRPERDREVTKRLLQRIGENDGGRMFLVFYDSTHHDYYWPNDFPARFQPVISDWEYFNFDINSEQLTGIRNRYRNALHFVDSLFGEVVSGLKSQGKYENTIIFVTGDHGEEFLEHGKLVHASELWREQTHVPFLLKLPGDFHRDGLERMGQLTASHVDFLPTLLDCLDVRTTNSFDGQSLFLKPEDGVLVADENGARDPYRFCLLNGDQKGWFQYRNDSTIIALEQNIYFSRVTDSHDRQLPIQVGSPEGNRILQSAFGPSLSRLYPNWAGRRNPVVPGREMK